MKIEDINLKTIAKATDKELHSLRLRFIQLWSKHFEVNKKSAAGDLKRKDLLRWYRILLKEMRGRKLTYVTKTIDRALFKKAMTNQQPRKKTDNWPDESVAVLHSILPFLKSRDSILGLGADVSRITALLAKYNYDVAGAETTPETIKKEKSGEGDLSFGDAEFDVVIGARIIEHSEDPEKLVSEVRRIAKRQVLFIVPTGASCNSIQKQVYKHLSDLRDLFKGSTVTAEWIKGGHGVALVASKTAASKQPPADNQTIGTAPKNNDSQVAKKSSNLDDDSDKVQTLKETLKSRHDTLKTEYKGLNKTLQLLPVSKAATEHIVYGIVSEPETEDAQGDVISEAEIRKAAYQFMEEAQTFKVNHDGKEVKIRILENFIAPDDFTVEGLPVKKGSWVLAVRVLNKKVWSNIVKGILTGYSISGEAERGEE